MRIWQYIHSITMYDCFTGCIKKPWEIIVIFAANFINPRVGFQRAKLLTGYYQF